MIGAEQIIQVTILFGRKSHCCTEIHDGHLSSSDVTWTYGEFVDGRPRGVATVQSRPLSADAAPPRLPFLARAGRPACGRDQLPFGPIKLAEDESRGSDGFSRNSVHFVQ